MKTLFVIVFYDTFANGVSWSALTTLIGSYQKLGLSVDRSYFALLTIYSISHLIGAPLLLLASDRIGRRKVILFSLGAGVIGSLATAYSPSVSWLYAARALAGISDATAPIVTACIVTLASDTKECTVLLGRLQACGAIGLIFGPAIGGGFTLLSASTPFLVIAIFSFLIWVAAYITLSTRENPHKNEDTLLSKSEKCLHGIRKNALVFVVFFFLIIADEMGLVIWPIYSRDILRLTSFMVGVSLTLCAFLVAITQTIALEALSRRSKTSTIIALGLSCTTFGYLMMITMGTKESFYSFIVAAVFLTTGGVSLPAIQALISKRFHAYYQGVLSGIFSSITAVSGMLAPMISGILYIELSHGDSVPLVWIIPGIASFLALMLFYVFMQISRHNS